MNSQNATEIFRKQLVVIGVELILAFTWFVFINQTLIKNLSKRVHCSVCMVQMLPSWLVIKNNNIKAIILGQEKKEEKKRKKTQE